jgi:hypothetical protein
MSTRTTPDEASDAPAWAKANPVLDMTMNNTAVVTAALFNLVFMEIPAFRAIDMRLDYSATPGKTF